MTGTPEIEQTAVNSTGTQAASDTNVTREGSLDVLGWTYFAQDGDIIKIGFSERPRHRIAHHRRQRPNLKTLAIVPTSVAGEYETHQRFAHLRTDGEWFRSEPELLAFIRRVKLAGAKVAAPPVAGQRKGAPPDLPIIAKLIALRLHHGVTSAVGYHCSNLTEMIPAYQTATDPERRAYIAAGIRRQMKGLARLKAQLN